MSPYLMLPMAQNIVKPYEEKIPVLGYNETVELTFQLQKDVESLQVSLNYPELEMPETRLIYLQKESRLRRGQCQFTPLFARRESRQQRHL